MTTGTVTSFNSSRKTGTITCASGATFLFSCTAALVLGERVRFTAVGGRAGTYAIRVESLASSHTARRAVQARRPVWVLGSPRLSLTA